MPVSASVHGSQLSFPEVDEATSPICVFVGEELGSRDLVYYQFCNGL